MEEKLKKLYNECVKELADININIINNPQIGKIDIKISNRNLKRYGCCKNENPDENSLYTIEKKNHLIIKYNKFYKHHIEISKWVMDLDEKIIKNTIIHEIIHCFPGCTNHKSNFKKYATLINQKLGYNISRVGNRQEDYLKSKLDLEEQTISYNYKIECEKCGQIYYRKRLKKDFIKKYRCGKCNRKLQIYKSLH